DYSSATTAATRSTKPSSPSAAASSASGGFRTHCDSSTKRNACYEVENDQPRWITCRRSAPAVELSCKGASHGTARVRDGQRLASKNTAESRGPGAGRCARRKARGRP